MDGNYLTNIVELGYKEGKVVGVLVGDPSEKRLGSTPYMTL